MPARAARGTAAPARRPPTTSTRHWSIRPDRLSRRRVSLHRTRPHAGSGRMPSSWASTTQLRAMGTSNMYEAMVMAPKATWVAVGTSRFSSTGAADQPNVPGAARPQPGPPRETARGVHQPVRHRVSAEELRLLLETETHRLRQHERGGQGGRVHLAQDSDVRVPSCGRPHGHVPPAPGRPTPRLCGAGTVPPPLPSSRAHLRAARPSTRPAHRLSTGAAGRGPC